MLYITLGAGFDGHHVSLALDGRPIFDSDGIVSSRLLGLATELPAIRATAASSVLEAVVSGPDGAELDRACRSLSTGEDLHLVIDLEPRGGGEARLAFATRTTPFGFG